MPTTDTAPPRESDLTASGRAPEPSSFLMPATGVRRLLGAVLSPRAVSRLAAVRRTMDLIVAGAVGVGLGVLSPRARVLTRSRLGSTGVLDYSGGTIRLVVDSEAELPRLRSCLKEPETVAWVERDV